MRFAFLSVASSALFAVSLFGCKEEPNPESNIKPDACKNVQLSKYFDKKNFNDPAFQKTAKTCTACVDAAATKAGWDGNEDKRSTEKDHAAMKQCGGDVREWDAYKKASDKLVMVSGPGLDK